VKGVGEMDFWHILPESKRDSGNLITMEMKSISHPCGNGRKRNFLKWNNISVYLRSHDFQPDSTTRSQNPFHKNSEKTQCFIFIFYFVINKTLFSVVKKGT